MRNANPTFRINDRERNDLVKAWALTSLAFAVFFLRGGITGLQSVTFADFALVFIVSALTAGLGFILHEMCHKFAAHRFRVHGEFYSNNLMLIASIFFAFMGFIFAAPGAVYITGHVTRRENGIISAAGPASNMVLALLFIPLLYLPGILGVIGVFGVLINAILGAFNLIPFFGLDGGKVLAWSKSVYFGMVLIAAGLVVLAYSLI